MARTGDLVLIWVTLALSFGGNPRPPICQAFQTRFGDNSGMMDWGAEDYSTDHNPGIDIAEVVRITTTSHSGIIGHGHFEPLSSSTTTPPPSTTSTTPATTTTTTTELPQIDVSQIDNATKVVVVCHGSSATITTHTTGEMEVPSPAVMPPTPRSIAAVEGQDEGEGAVEGQDEGEGAVEGQGEGEAEVDLAEVTLGGSTVVGVESQGCGRVDVVGVLPAHVTTLALTTTGVMALVPYWSSTATELSVRASVGLQLPEEIDLCSILPPSLKILDVSRSEVGELVVGGCNTSLTRLQATHTALTRIALCTPTLRSLHVSSNQLATSIAFASCPGGLDEVELLQATHNFIPTASTCGWPNLHTLDLRHNHLTSLDLTTCPPRNLTSLTASRNLLVRPPAELAASLLHLDLSRNKLVDLPPLTHDLMTADFSHNAIAEVGKHRFKRARRLLHLDLAHNHLQHLHVHDLAGLRSLRTLDLSYNKLREIAPGTFRHLRHLHRLQLHHNHLTTLDARDLAALSSHAHAVLHHNPWVCTCSLLSALQSLQECAKCQHQSAVVECKERGEWVPAAAVLKSCQKAFQDVTQYLQESDEDLSEEDDDDLVGKKDGSGEGAVMVVPGLVVLLLMAVAVVLGYRVCRKHSRTIRGTLEPFCCNCCGASTATTTLSNHNHHSLQHTHLQHTENDSDTETEL